MLDGLSGGDHGGVARVAVLDLLQQLFTLFEDAVDAGALLAAGFLAAHFEDLIEALHLLPGLLQMLLEALLQLGRRCLLRHFGKRFDDLILGVIDVLERMKKKVFQIIRGLGHVVLRCLASGVAVNNTGASMAVPGASG